MSGATVVHELPHRLRLRLAGPDRVGAAVAPTLLALPGVRGVRFNRRARTLAIEHDGRPQTRAAVLRLVAAPPSSLPVPLAAPGLPGLADEPEVSPARLILAGVATVAALLLPLPLRRLVTLANITPTLAHGATTLIQRGVKVPVLDALSLAVATGRGEFATANAAQFLLDLATYIESSSARRSDDLIRALLRPGPSHAWVEHAEGVVSVPVEQLQAGDRVHVLAGEMIPVDGVVLSGAATVNQSSVTGESLPLPKEEGAPALSGTLVEEGRLVILAERVGDQTTTAGITRFIRDALDRRGPLQTVAEQLADRRVWLSLGSGALVYALTGDARRLESLFLVDYSCAIKLGSAVAVKSALYRGARAGLLIKGGQALEALAGVDAVVFDKTGTLTHGDLEVTEVVCLDPQRWPRDRLLATIASVAEHTSHPVAAAVVALARAEQMAHIGHEEVDFVIGHGLSTRIAQGVLRLGSHHYLVDHEQVPFAPHRAQLERLEAQGQTLLHVALDGRPLGVIALRDRPRRDIAATLARLRRLGVQRLVMVTGDRPETAHKLAQGLDLDQVVAEADPEHKAWVIQSLKAKGARVAFVGDGVNDGPALMAADVGIAMPQAADLARATADVVLLDDRLELLPEAFELARSTLAVIRRGFGTAVGVNTGIMAGASFGWLSPVVSSLLHNGTTVALLIDALTGAAPPSPALPSGPGPRHSARRGPGPTRAAA